MKQKILVLLFFIIIPCKISSDGLNTLKGVWTSVESFGEKFAGVFTMLGQSFGAPPSGYVYSFDVHNDLSSQSVCVAVSEIMSFMGGDLPKPHGWTTTMVAPGKSYSVSQQDYYFEMFIKLTDTKYSSCMPYLPHADLLYRHDATALEGQKHSQRLHYFRAFMGKNMQNGVYIHTPKAESLGYINQNPADAQTDPGSVTTGTSLSSLTIYNSSPNDYYVGFTDQASATTMTKASCLSYGLVQANSFALLSSFGSVTTFTPGTFAIFDARTQELVKTYAMPTKIFETLPTPPQTSPSPMSYTLEIYQDPAVSGIEQPVCIEMQGLMSGNYDQPMGKVRDITPVTCVFWYESAQQIANSDYNDVTPGKVWVVSVESAMSDAAQTLNPVVITGATPGQALQFSIMRPHLGNQLWLYFIYVDTATDSIAQQYITNFFANAAGQSMLQTYQGQMTAQMQLAQEPAVATATKKVTIPQALLVESAQGTLTLNGGAVVDAITGVTGYLLGADIFIPNGVGAGPMYYQLLPSQSNSANLMIPAATVQNLYISNPGSTATPSGMPAATVVS